MTYTSSKNLTIDQELLNSEDYKTCITAIEYLRLSGMVEHAAGNCIAMADLLQHTLREFSIPNRIVECKLVMTIKNSGNVKEFRYVGFNGSTLNSQFVDTHVVVVTDTRIPMVIDLSISHMLSNGRVWVVERLLSDDPEIITKINFPECSITYSHKKMIRLLGLHQTTLLQRISEEIETKKKLSFIQKITIVLGIFAFINFSLNSSLLIMKYNSSNLVAEEIKK